MTGRLDSSYQSGHGQRAQHVVDGLSGDIRQIVTDHADNRLGVGVGISVHRIQYGHPWAGHAKICGPQVLGVVGG